MVRAGLPVGPDDQVERRRASAALTTASAIGVRSNARSGRTGDFRRRRDGEMFGPAAGKRWKILVPERNDATNPSVSSNFHDRLTARHHRTIRPDERVAEAHDVPECEKTTRQDQTTVLEVDVEPGDLFRDRGMADEDLTVPPDCGVRGKAASKQVTSAVGILLCEGPEADLEERKHRGTVHGCGVGRLLHAV